MRSFIKSAFEFVSHETGVDALIIANIAAIIMCIIISRGYENQERWERQTVVVVITATVFGTIYNISRIFL